MKIFCIGRNYVNHAREMNSKVPEKPMVFMKPATALLKPGNDFYLPDFSNNVHYECELVVKICKNGKHIERQFASRYYKEVTLGIDFTARDVQAKCKEKGHPWEIAKAFDNSAPIGEFVGVKDGMKNLHFKLLKNGEEVQKGNSNDMIFNIDHLISYISKIFSLQRGDLIMTGTPEGVGPVAIGDVLTGILQDEELLRVNVK